MENNLAEIKEKLNKFVSLNLFLFIPMTFVFYYYGDIIIRILFQRGAFTSADTQITFDTLKYFSLSFIFYSSYSVLNKLMYSLELAKQLLVITVIGCTIKILFNFLLVGSLKQNGLALSTSISYFIFFISSLFFITRIISPEISRIFITKLLILSVDGALAYLMAVLISDILGEIISL